MAKQAGSILKELTHRSTRLPEMLDRMETVLEANARHVSVANRPGLPGFVYRPVSSLIFLAVTLTGSVLAGTALYHWLFS